MNDPAKGNSETDPAAAAIQRAGRRFAEGKPNEGLAELAAVLLEQPFPGYPEGVRERFEKKLAAATAAIHAFDHARLAATAMFKGEPPIGMHRWVSAASPDLAAQWDAAIMEAVEAMKRREVGGQDETGEIIK